jgi:hypothetical protein
MFNIFKMNPMYSFLKKPAFSILLAISLLTSANTIAQNRTANSKNYKTAVGLKFLNGGGVTLKTFFSDKEAAEFIGFFYYQGTRITGLYEFHGSLNTEGNLRWYLGVGGHASLYRENNLRGFGVDGVIGIDFKFPNKPFNIAIDWQPSVEFGGGVNNGFKDNWGGLALRYTL